MDSHRPKKERRRKELSSHLPAIKRIVYRRSAYNDMTRDCKACNILLFGGKIDLHTPLHRQLI